MSQGIRLHRVSFENIAGRDGANSMGQDEGAVKGYALIYIERGKRFIERVLEVIVEY